MGKNDISNLKQLFEKNKASISELSLISHEGEILEFLSAEKMSVDQTNRIISTVLANISLSGRATEHLNGQRPEKIFLKGNKSSVLILLLKHNFLYLKTSLNTIEQLKNIINDIQALN